MRNATQTVVEAEHLVLHRLLLVLLATFGLNRTPNLLSRNFLDKRSGPKMHGCFNLLFFFLVSFLFSFCLFFLFLGFVHLEFLAGKVFHAVTCSCFHGSLILDIDVDLTLMICSQFSFSDQNDIILRTHGGVGSI